MNSVCIIGRLVYDPEVKELENNQKVSTITVAVPRSYKNVDGEYETDFIQCCLWNGVAQNVSNYCNKGDLVAVNGRLQVRQFEREDSKVSKLELIAERISFLEKSKKKENLNDMDM